MIIDLGFQEEELAKRIPFLFKQFSPGQQLALQEAETKIPDYVAVTWSSNWRYGLLIYRKVDEAHSNFGMLSFPKP